MQKTEDKIQKKKKKTMKNNNNKKKTQEEGKRTTFDLRHNAKCKRTQNAIDDCERRCQTKIPTAAKRFTAALQDFQPTAAKRFTAAVQDFQPIACKKMVHTHTRIMLCYNLFQSNFRKR